MQSLLEFIQLSEMNELKDITGLLEADLSSLISRHKDNPVGKFSPEQDSNLDTKLEEAIKRLQAARHGLGIANRLRNPEDQKKNKSRIMKNLNLLRNIVQMVEKELAGDAQQTAVKPNNGGQPNQQQARQPQQPQSGGMSESVVNEKWDTDSKTPKSKQGMFKGKSKADLTKEYNKLKKSGPHKKGSKQFTKMKELAFALRAKKKFGKVEPTKKDDKKK